MHSRIRRSSICGLATLVLLFVLAPGDARAEAKGEANFVLGGKMLDEDDWEPTEEQREFGVELSWGAKDWPIFIATDLLGAVSNEDVFDPLLGNVELTARTRELAVGVRKIWEAGAARPYLGGGLALLWAEAEADTSFFGSGSEDGSGGGLWFGGGIYWRLGSRFNIGVAGRISRGEVDLGGVDVQAGGNHLGLILGWGWPATP
jgi:hypothetical protein